MTVNGNRLQVALAKRLMKLRPSHPNPDDFSLNEVFRHARFLSAVPAERRLMLLASAQCRFDDEEKKPFFELYFPNHDYKRHLAGKVILDLGCFTGGRGVHWAMQYGVKRLLGTDINPVYLEAARQYAATKGVDSEFALLDMGAGARIPCRFFR